MLSTLNSSPSFVLPLAERMKNVKIPDNYVTLTRHAKILGLWRLEATFGAWNGFILLIFEPFTTDMVFAEANLALKAGVLPDAVTWLALVIFRLEDLAGCLVFKLVILAEVCGAEGAPEDPSSVVPDTSLALSAHGVHQRARAWMCRQTFPPMAHPRFAEVTNGALNKIFVLSPKLSLFKFNFLSNPGTLQT